MAPAQSRAVKGNDAGNSKLNTTATTRQHRGKSDPQSCQGRLDRHPNHENGRGRCRDGAGKLAGKEASPGALDEAHGGAGDLQRANFVKIMRATASLIPFRESERRQPEASAASVEVQRDDIPLAGRGRSPALFWKRGVERACPLARVWGAQPQPPEAGERGRGWRIENRGWRTAGHGCDRGQRGPRVTRFAARGGSGR